MAEKFEMHELHDQCERAIVMHWECFQDRHDLVNQLSSSALKRIAKGLNRALFASTSYSNQTYPDVREFAAWRKEKERTAH